jgi:hypothetical protein
MNLIFLVDAVIRAPASLASSCQQRLSALSLREAHTEGGEREETRSAEIF